MGKAAFQHIFHELLRSPLLEMCLYINASLSSKHIFLFAFFQKIGKNCVVGESACKSTLKVVDPRANALRKLKMNEAKAS